MRLKAILAALRQLDERSLPLSTSETPGKAHVRSRIVVSPSRLSREANVRRYRRLLATKLTEHERDFVQRRLTEELVTPSSVGARA